MCHPERSEGSPHHERRASRRGSLAALGMTLVVAATLLAQQRNTLPPLFTQRQLGGDEITRVKEQAHVQPRLPELWRTSANPQRTYTKVLGESPEFIRFINPGENRVAQEACGGCHQKQVNAVPRSTMTTSSVFWAAV